MLEITPVPAFSDNYIWVLASPASTRVAVVDPGDEKPVLAFLHANGLELGAIVITHLHGDHTGGVRDLVARYPGIPVFGPAHERVAGRTHPVGEGDTVLLPGIDLHLRVMDVPGHTAGHVAYQGEGFLFCGDTLFAAGCGRVFSGTLEDLHASLGRIAALPTETRIYCAHEYTLDNLGFAKWVEPDSDAIREREARDEQRRDEGQPTVPSTLELELATNPFLRTAEPVVRQAAEAYAGRPLATDAEVFAALRTWKDQEYD